MPRQYRYETLLALNSPLDVELKLMDELAVAFLKTYQVWHHRRLLLMLTRNPGPELKFIAESLQVDVKNYHTWSYRQWLLAYFNDKDLWAGELDFVEAMIVHDVRNNSAWHHRFFVVFQSGIREGETDRARIIRRELTCVFLSTVSFFRALIGNPRFVKQNISFAANNPSAWNYLRGILNINDLPYSRVEDFVRLYADTSADAIRDVVDLENPPPSKGAKLPCPAAIEFLADIHEKEGRIMQAAEVSAPFWFAPRVLTLLCSYGGH